jgi:hypothetical protein
MKTVSWADLVKKYYPEVSEEVAEMLLWETTCFPMGSPQQVENNLKENVAEYGQDIQKCIDGVYAKLTEEMSRARFWEILNRE